MLRSVADIAQIPLSSPGLRNKPHIASKHPPPQEWQSIEGWEWTLFLETRYTGSCFLAYTEAPQEQEYVESIAHMQYKLPDFQYFQTISGLSVPG
jgi:hypothetical protein